ncbi:hypothetical protein [Luteibacter sp. dw_328]|uniref:hypothetical protein n=1 Tax=Luteibacter sp. dw_328 TaxID=2719796 RepID=UPI001BD55DF6|nr:hypothetical protein [Luteibacter sp. dw_328]
MSERRWKVNLVWFIIVLAGGMTSFCLSSYTVGYVLTQIAWQNDRGEHFGNVKAAVWLFTQNDLASYHRFSMTQLRDGIGHLAAEDGDLRCSDNQRRTLSHAASWLKDHPDRDPGYTPLQSFMARGLRACDRP